MVRVVFAFVIFVVTSVHAAQPRLPERERSPRESVFTIQFEGLMTHVGSETTKTHVAVLNAPGHQAIVEVRGADRLGAAADLRIELQPGDVVSFDLPPGEAPVDAVFRETVPRLSQVIRNGTLRETVALMQPDSAVTAYLKYPAGLLTVTGTFANPVEYRFGDGEFAAKHCAARFVSFRMQTNQRIVTMSVVGPSRRLSAQLRAGAAVRITNNPPHTTSGGHFAMYLDLTSGTAIADVIDDPLSLCTERELHAGTISDGSLNGAPRPGTIRLADDVPGCSNSQWP